MLVTTVGGKVKFLRQKDKANTWLHLELDYKQDQGVYHHPKPPIIVFEAIFTPHLAPLLLG